MTSSDTTPALSHFTALTSNVKEVVKELPLGPLTAIVGEEGTYKSSLSIAMRLALTGRYEPVGHNPSDLIALAADALVGIEVRLSGKSGLAEWRLKVDPETGKPKKSVPPHFEGEIGNLTEDERYCIVPTDSVRDLLKSARGDKKLREAFIRRFGGSIKEVVCPFTDEEEDAKEKKAWDAGVDECKRKMDADASADTLLATLSEHFRKESGAKRREISPIEKFVEEKKRQLSQMEMTGGIAPELLPELEEEYQAALAWENSEADRQAKKEAEEDINGSDGLGGLKSEVEPARQELADAELATKQLKEELKLQLETMHKRVADAYSDSIHATRAAATYATLADLYREQEQKGLMKCRFCPNEFDSIDPVIATRKLFEERAEARSSDAEKADEEYKLAKHAELTLESSVMQRISAQELCERIAKEKFEDCVDTVESEEKNLADINARLAKCPKTKPVKSSIELQTQLNAYKAATDARVATEREALRLRKLEKEYDLFKKLEGEAMVLQKAVMSRVARRASDEVSLGMTDGRRARLDAVSCEWYLTRKDGKEYGPFGALCGTEKTALMLGLVAAWTRGSPLRVAIFDDEDMVGLSTKGIADFYTQCEQLYDRGDFTQIVIVNNRPELVPTNGRWNVILRSPILC